jgi:DNA repair protein RadD
MKISLRDYQINAIESLRSSFRNGNRRVILCAPTGSGKSTIFSEIARSCVDRGGKVLAVAHRQELVYQLRDRLFSEHRLPSGVIMAGCEQDEEAAIQVASIQTLKGRTLPPSTLVCIDECHHSTAATYRKLLENYPDSFVIGMTATPWRQNGRGLGSIWQDIIVAATPKQLIKEGTLVDYVGFTFATPDLDNVTTTAGDFNLSGLDSVCTEGRIIGGIVEKWLDHANNVPTICFAVNIKHAEMICSEFNKAGVTSKVIHHGLGKDDRSGIINDVKSGSIRVVCNVGIFGEGVDIPNLECAILARPTQSLVLHLQQVGRVLRPSPGKARARIHDHAGNLMRLGLPDDERDYSLLVSNVNHRDGNFRRLVRSCEKCFAIIPIGRPACMECGHQHEVEDVKYVDGNVVDIKSVKFHSIAEKAREMDEYKRSLIALCLSRGLKGGYLVHKFLEKFPYAPKPWKAFRIVKERNG